MSIPLECYTSSNMKRTLASLKKCASLPKSRPASQRLGVQHRPILSLEPESVLIDELHLLLRVGDVLIRNLVWEIVDANRRSTHTITPQQPQPPSPPSYRLSNNVGCVLGCGSVGMPMESLLESMIRHH